MPGQYHNTVLVRFNEDPDTLKDRVHLEEDLGGNGVEVEPLACVRKSVWGMLYADDAGIVCKSAEGLANMMTVFVTVFEAAGLTVSKRKRRQCCTLNQVLPTSPLVVEAAGQRYTQTLQFLYLGGLSTQTPTSCQRSKDGSDSRGHATIVSSGLYDMEDAPFTLKVRLLKTEVMETLLCGCVTWALGLKHFAKLRAAHHNLLLRIIGFRRRQRTDHCVSYAKALKKAQCKSVKITIRKRRLLFAGVVRRTTNG